MARPCITES